MEFYVLVDTGQFFSRHHYFEMIPDPQRARRIIPEHISGNLFALIVDPAILAHGDQPPVLITKKPLIFSRRQDMLVNANGFPANRAHRKNEKASVAAEHYEFLITQHRHIFVVAMAGK